jgi:hypothetical protein
MTGQAKSPGIVVPGLWSRSVWIIAYLLLAGYLVFAHGCHGEDVDTELLVPTWGSSLATAGH